AMKTMGLSRLCLVQSGEYPQAEAIARAAGAADILASALVYKSLDEALMNCVLVIGTTARARSLEWPCITPAECARTLLQYSEQGEVALVFGRERSGLTNAELDRCRFMTSISANPEYNSLNLAAAVQVYGHELRQVLEGEPRPTVVPDTDELPATGAVMEGFYEHLQQALTDIGVIEADRPHETLLRRLRRLFNRTRLTVTEVNILRGILSAVQGRKERRRNAK
ncbi:MAG TPA: TrmJ/YjtD family RNA methyltransferase, partial [Gammaproteobacteria bacterium]